MECQFLNADSSVAVIVNQVAPLWSGAVSFICVRTVTVKAVPLCQLFRNVKLAVISMEQVIHNENTSSAKIYLGT